MPSPILIFYQEESKISSPTEFSHRGYLDKQNPDIALKVLRYINNHPDSFHSKWKELSKAKYRLLVKYLAEECGAFMYLRAGGGKFEKMIKNLYGNLKKW